MHKDETGGAEVSRSTERAAPPRNLNARLLLSGRVVYAGDWREFASLFVCVAFWGAAWIVAGRSGRDLE